ncbi:MAG: class I SAM-dependent methyltransferase [Anaerolineae bacterium]|jgi:SAM-dependent methyltransferase|nr:class I SAM-dependent methyltransferase [Anaerolineae bacterium]
MSFYTEFAETYESIFPFSGAVYALLRRHLPVAPARVLDIGCGTGHYAGALAAEGYVALGIDLDPAMVAYALAHYPAAEFRLLDMREIASLDGTFDLVACVGNTAAHLPQGQFVRFVDAVNQVRTPGAPWILQVMNWDYVLMQDQVTFPVVEGTGGATFYRAYRDITPTQVTFTTRLELSGRVVFEDAVALYPMTSDEIIRMHRARGYDVVEHLGSYSGAPFDPDVFSANIIVFR